MKKKMMTVPCMEGVLTITISCKYQEWWFELMKQLGKFLKKEKINHSGGSLRAIISADSVEWCLSLLLKESDARRVKDFTAGQFLIKR
jgi:ribosome-associated protein YbcJ (S4-like RNA binding protein)